MQYIADTANKINTPAPKGEEYHVKAGDFQKKADADRRVAALKAKGFDAKAVRGGKGYWVDGGRFGDPKKAQALARKIQKKGFNASACDKKGARLYLENEKWAHVKVGEFLKKSDADKRTAAYNKKGWKVTTRKGGKGYWCDAGGKVSWAEAIASAKTAKTTIPGGNASVANKDGVRIYL